MVNAGMFRSQLELVGTGICRGGLEVSNEELADRKWFKYRTDGTPEGDAQKTDAEDMYWRLGVKSRPKATPDQDHTSLFAEAMGGCIGGC